MFVGMEESTYFCLLGGMTIEAQKTLFQITNKLLVTTLENVTHSTFTIIIKIITTITIIKSATIKITVINTMIIKTIR